MGSEPAIRAEGIEKDFKNVRALAGIDLEIDRGSVFGLLGPNGAGKTTFVRILSTLLRASRGRAEVAGFDVRREADEVRARIGLTGQFAAVDNDLTGRENLVMFGQLLGIGKTRAKTRADELLDRFGLTGAADRTLRGYSGGMRRRLDLAASLVGEPEIAFLDEPTTGLDPRSRLELWDIVEDLVAQGTTVLLTTQYLEEVDRLADRIGVIDHGRVIALGTPEELKDAVGGRVIAVDVDTGDVDAAVAALDAEGGKVVVDREAGRLNVPTDGAARVADVVRDLDAAGVGINGLELHSPSLDDVFLTLTGTRASDEEGEER
ncbi:MAG: ATP-binding cassette domain-containing protein [Acidimicrobiia bacterium]|nr:ATP-binding cassette domain-containing protein [Acidimicrobiia bacterium]